MASTFNRTVWRTKGEAIASEFRAFNNLNWYRGYQFPYAFTGLLGFGIYIFILFINVYNNINLKKGPNINIVRDPRFGRNSELPSEDPFLAGSYPFLSYFFGL